MEKLEPEIKQTLGLNVYLTDITPQALDSVLEWEKSYAVNGKGSYQPGWDWDKLLKKFRRRPRRVELAIWVDQELCGLALGRISDKRVVATIHFIEANPNTHPLKGKIVPVATRFLEALGIYLAAREITIEQPIPELVDYYKRIGYNQVDKKGQKILRLKRKIEES